MLHDFSYFFFFFNDTATTEIYTLSLHDALPIFDAISESFWMPPHRSYITVAIGSTAILAGVITVAIGAFDASDIVTIALAATAAIAILGLQVADAGRRLSVAAVPSDLDVSAAIAAFLGTVAIVLVLALPLADASL